MDRAIKILSGLPLIRQPFAVLYFNDTFVDLLNCERSHIGLLTYNILHDSIQVLLLFKVNYKQESEIMKKRLITILIAAAVFAY